jgi:hypothetical protein
MPEDLVGGLMKSLNLSWTKESIKLLFLIADAPTHGLK